MKPVRRALISVSDKTGILEFAESLIAMNIAILSTGGTYKVLSEAGLAVTEVSEYTGFPEMMDGRVKTLHPKIHGGLLGRRGTDDAVMAEHGIDQIDMVVVNLYPFEATVAKADCSLEDAVENIDIGGPTMLRSAAKNHKDVAVVTDPMDYARILAEMTSNNGQLSHATRFDLAIKTFEQTARYDGAIANYFGTMFSTEENDAFPRTYSSQFVKNSPYVMAKILIKKPLSTQSAIRMNPLFQQPLSYKVKRSLSIILRIQMRLLSWLRPLMKLLVSLLSMPILVVFQLVQVCSKLMTVRSKPILPLPLVELSLSTAS